MRRPGGVPLVQIGNPEPARTEGEGFVTTANVLMHRNAPEGPLENLLWTQHRDRIVKALSEARALGTEEERARLGLEGASKTIVEKIAEFKEKLAAAEANRAEWIATCERAAEQSERCIEERNAALARASKAESALAARIQADPATLAEVVYERMQKAESALSELRSALCTLAEVEPDTGETTIEVVGLVARDKAHVVAARDEAERKVAAYSPVLAYMLEQTSERQSSEEYNTEVCRLLDAIPESLRPAAGAGT